MNRGWQPQPEKKHVRFVEQISIPVDETHLTESASFFVCMKKIDKTPAFVPSREDLLQFSDAEVRMMKIKKILYSRDLVCLTFMLSKFQQSPPKDCYGEV